MGETICAASPSRTIFQSASARPQTHASEWFPLRELLRPSTQIHHVWPCVSVVHSRCDRRSMSRYLHRLAPVDTAVRQSASACSAAQNPARGTCHSIHAKRAPRPPECPARKRDIPAHELATLSRGPLLGRCSESPSQPAIKSHFSLARLRSVENEFLANYQFLKRARPPLQNAALQSTPTAPQSIPVTSCCA